MSRNPVLQGILAALLALSIAPARVTAATPEPSIAGAWELHDGAIAVRFVFEANGTGSMNGIPLQWSFRQGELALSIDGENASYQASVDGDLLRLSGGDLAAEVSLRKSGAPAASGSDPRLHGKWQSANGSIIELRPDGTGTNLRGNFRYTAADGVLVFDDGMTSVSLAYRIQNDQLVFTSNTEQAVFARAQAGVTAAAAGKRSVVVNRTKLREDAIRTFETRFQVRMLDGKYWYDAACGAWGLEGGPCIGFLPPKLALGGPLAADASGGGTGVFVNGRELHPVDVAALQRITPVQPGRFWLDAVGNCGYEGNPIPVVNLVQLAGTAKSSSGGAYHSRSNITGIGSGGDGQTSYVMGDGWSVIVGQ